MELEEEIDCEEDIHPFDHLKEFIETLEFIPELWDMKHHDYNNKCIRYEKYAILLPIIEKMKPNSVLDDVRRKINSLRNIYRRELKKMAANDKYVPKIWYYPLLHFLGGKKTDPIMTLKLQHESPFEVPTTKNLTKIPSTKKIHEASDDSKYFNKPITQFSQSPLLLAEPLNSSCQSPESINPPSSAPNKQPKKLKRYTQNGQSSKSITKTNHKNSQSPKSITQPFIPNTSFNQHLVHPIALEWASTLERLDPIQRLFAKKAINDVLFEAELGNLCRDSVSINLNNSKESGVVFTSSQYSHASGNNSGQDSSNNSTLPSPLGSPKSED